MVRRLWFVLIGCVAFMLVTPGEGVAQSLRFKIERIFDEVLSLQLGGSPGAHGLHFNPNNVASSQKVINALTGFIGTNLGQFPLSSTGATILFDLSSGVPVRRTGSLGPIFSEDGTTLGHKRVILGYTFTYMNLNKLRGLEVSDMRFTFTHQDVGAPGLGDSDNEFDTISLLLDMKLEASILAFYFTAGVTNRLDVGVALPLVNAHITADPIATIESFTLVSNDSANHFYAGDTTDPGLTTEPTPINDSATGIGDIALRAKYNFYEKKADLAGLLEVRLPTGDEDNFLGSGNTTIKAILIASRSWDGFTPHANLAYIFRTGDLENDDIELVLGYDQMVTGGFTFVLDLFGKFQISDTPDELQFDQTATISRPISNTVLVRHVELSNTPQANRDHRIDLSIGGKWAPKEFLIVLGNVFLPLNDGGLRSDFVGTLGFEFNF